MQAMMTISMLLNVLVLLPVCASLILNANWTRASFGEPTPARGILLSIYIAIGLLSAVMLFAPQSQVVFAILLLQVIYKVTTPFTVRTLRNPVVISNLVIAAVHIVTIVLTQRGF